MNFTRATIKPLIQTTTWISMSPLIVRLTRLFSEARSPTSFWKKNLPVLGLTQATIKIPLPAHLSTAMLQVLPSL